LKYSNNQIVLNNDSPPIRQIVTIQNTEILEDLV